MPAWCLTTHWRSRLRRFAVKFQLHLGPAARCLLLGQLEGEEGRGESKDANPWSQHDLIQHNWKARSGTDRVLAGRIT